MGRLFGMIQRVAVYGVFGAAVGYVGVAIFQVLYVGGPLQQSFSSGDAKIGALAGLVLGAIVGFVRRV